MRELRSKRVGARRAPWSVPLRAARHLSQEAAAARVGSPLALLAALRSRVKGEMTGRRLIEVMTALQDAGVACWIAGGWGVDALAGVQSRHHDDADIVLGDFEDQARAACSALAQLGLVLVRRERHGGWMPDQWTLVDRRRGRVDLVSIDWSHVAGADPALARAGAAWDRGSVRGTTVPCLSARAQLLFHSGYASRPTDRRDLAALEG